MSRHIFNCLAAVLPLVVAAPAAPAMTTGHTPDGFDFIIGGIGFDEVAQMTAESAAHSLSLRLAARGTGAYLADVKVEISDSHGRQVFDGHVDAPWLLISLPPGRYRIAAIYEGQVERTEVVVPAHGHRAVVMRFLADSGLQLAPGEQP